MKLKIKVITGYRDDQYFTIDAEEAHKAYYLFLNPSERGVFSDGNAVRGQDIMRIEPDYHATMGWNKGYKLGPYDWEDIRSKGVDDNLRDVMSDAKRIVALDNPKMIQLPLSEAKKELLLLDGE